MATVDELRGMAHDLYARARASLDPSKKQKLVKSADVTPHPRPRPCHPIPRLSAS